MGAPRRDARHRTRRGRGPRGPERLGQVDAAPADRRDHQADRRERRNGRPRRLAARAGRGLPPRLHGPRERRAERGAAGSLPPADPRAVRRDRGLRGARARDRPAGEDVLVRHDDATRVRDRRLPRGRPPAARRGLRGRRREFSAEVLRRDLVLQGARRHDPLRLARRLRRRASLRPGSPAPAGRARVRRAGARGDPAVPSRPRRGGRSAVDQRARAGRHGGGEDRGREARGLGRRAAGQVPRRRAVRARDRPRRRSGGAGAPSRAAGRLGLARRRGARRDGEPGLERGRGGARPAARRAVLAAPVRPLRRNARPARRRRAAARQACRGVPLLVYPDGESRGLVRLEGTWRTGAKETPP